MGCMLLSSATSLDIIPFLVALCMFECRMEFIVLSPLTADDDVRESPS